MSTKIILSTVLAISLLPACKKEDNAPVPGSCFADNITLTQTDFVNYPANHSVFVSFDAKNTSTKDYDVSRGAKLVNMEFIITTADGAEHVTHIGLTKTYIPAGTSTSVIIYADYEAGHTYQSYKVHTSCK
jgi:hypothetical protein